jgi:hypothetical protein
MRRRDFMRAVVAVTVAPSTVVAQTIAPTAAHQARPAPGPVPWMQGLDKARLESVATLSPEEIAQDDLGFFHPEQMAALTRLGDLLVPPLNGNPGAKEARTPEFLDFFVGESPDEIKQMYQGGLDRLNSDAKQRFNSSFAKLNDAQADSLLRPLLRTWMQDHYPTGSQERFINAAHHDIRMATTNSPAWAEAAERRGKPAPGEGMYWSPVEPDVYWEESRLVRRTNRDAKHRN